MSNYVKATNFASKDSLPVGDANKKVKGTEIDNEFNAISNAIESKADANSPTLTGTPVAPTAALGTDTTQLATTAFVQQEVTDATGSLGTMSTQDATAVNIDGGTIDGTTITASGATFTSSTFSGDGSGLTALNATQLTSGTVPAARIPAATGSTLGGVKVSLSGSTLTISTT